MRNPADVRSSTSCQQGVSSSSLAVISLRTGRAWRAMTCHSLARWVVGRRIARPPTDWVTSTRRSNSHGWRAPGFIRCTFPLPASCSSVVRVAFMSSSWRPRQNSSRGGHVTFSTSASHLSIITSVYLSCSVPVLLRDQ